MDIINFEWDVLKNKQNQIKHEIGFELAQYAFNDPKRVIAWDNKHSTKDEQRFFLLRHGRGCYYNCAIYP
jgi:uncharacterized DUF497 family protein